MKSFFLLSFTLLLISCSPYESLKTNTISKQEYDQPQRFSELTLIFEGSEKNLCTLNLDQSIYFHHSKTLDSFSPCNNEIIPEKSQLSIHAQPGFFHVTTKLKNELQQTEELFTHTNTLHYQLPEKFKGKQTFSLKDIQSISFKFQQTKAPFEKELEALLEKSYKTNSPKASVIKIQNKAQLESLFPTLKGGETLVITQPILEEVNLYASEPIIFEPAVHLIGAQSNKPYILLNHLNIHNYQNIKISQFSVNRRTHKINPQFGFSTDFMWILDQVKNVTLSDLHFFGSRDSEKDLRSGRYQGALNDPQGLYLARSENIVVRDNLFDNLYHAVVYKNIRNLVIHQNKTDWITSDSFTGGGVINGLYSQNEDRTKTPLLVGSLDVHSDFIQLHTTGKDVSFSENIIVRDNIKFRGVLDTEDNPYLVGWQCVLFRNEDATKTNQSETYFRKIFIYNNICESNQNHGISIDHGSQIYIANNSIIPTKDSKQISSPIRLRRTNNSQVYNNISKHILTHETFEGNFTLNHVRFGNIETILSPEFNAAYQEALIDGLSLNPVPLENHLLFTFGRIGFDPSRIDP